MLKLFKIISVYSFGNILSALVSFLLLPVYTRILTPDDYGVLELTSLFAAFIGLIFGLNVSNGYSRIYFDCKNIDSKKTLFFTGQIFTLITALLISIVILLSSSWVSHSIFNSNVSSQFLILITGSTIFTVLTRIPMTNLQIRQLPKQYIALSLLGFLLTALSTIVLVVIHRLGVLGVLYGQLIGSILQFAFLSFYTRNEYGLSFSRTQLMMMLSFSIFLIPANLSSLVLNLSNRWFLQEYQTIGDVGLYSLGAKFAAIIPMLFTEPVKQAFSPYLYQKIDNPEELKQTLSDFSRIFFIGLSVVVLGISLFTRETIMIIADKSYYGSQNVTFILSISFLFLGLAGIIVQGIQVVKKTWIITIIWIISSILNVFLNILLVPVYGRIGAAFATLISVFIICVSYFIAVKKTYPIKFNYFSYSIVLFLITIFNFIGSTINYGIAISILLKLILLVSYITTLLLIKIITKDEIEFFKKNLSIYKSRLPIKKKLNL